MKKTGVFRRAVVAAFFALVLISIAGPTVAFAQEPKSEAIQIAELGRPVWHYAGAAIGLGLVVVGAATGIGRFTAAAAEGIARQPAAAAQISGAISLPLFLLEGVAVLAEVFTLLIVLK
jgi:F-type H+-transporting ATPase subunit c